MRLSAEELARLELLFTAGQIRSDPSIPSATDRLMDAMRLSAQQRLSRRRGPQSRNEKSDARHAASIPRPSDVVIGQGNETTVVDGSQIDWNLPHTLEELIQIRLALLRNEDPNP